MIHNIRVRCFENIDRKLKDVKESHVPLNTDLFCELIVLAHEPDIFEFDIWCMSPFVDCRNYWCLINLKLMHIVSIVKDPDGLPIQYRICELTSLGKILVNRITDIKEVSDKIFSQRGLEDNIIIPSSALNYLNIEQAYNSLYNLAIFDRLDSEAQNTRKSCTELVLKDLLQLYAKGHSIVFKVSSAPYFPIDDVLCDYTCNRRQDFFGDHDTSIVHV